MIIVMSDGGCAGIDDLIKPRFHRRYNMTADERYAECKTREELDKAYRNDRYSAETLEYMAAIDKAYEKHIERFMNLPSDFIRRIYV